MAAPATTKWPLLRMLGCSHCGQLAVSSGAHWCKGTWRAEFDTVIRYKADHAGKVDRK